jgi:hypothetical protein
MVVEVDGTYDEVNRLCAQVAEERHWAFVNFTLRPYYVEGSKTLLFETAEQLGWRLPDALVVPVAHEGEKLALLQEQQDVYFTTPHYDGSAYVLVRLEVVDPGELRELVEDAWYRRASKRQLAERERERG